MVTVKAAFELSWLELTSRAQKLACLLSLFALTPISWSLVEQCLPDEDEEDLEDLRDTELIKLSLLRRTDNQTYQLHELLHQYFQNKLQLIPEPEKLKHQFCHGMVLEAQKMPQTPTRDHINKLKLSVPHLAESATELKQWLKNEDLVWPFVGLSRFYEGQGLYELAEPWKKKCLQVCQAMFEGDHPDVALSLNNLANLYDSQGRYSEAEPLLSESLEMRKRLFEGDHPDVALSLNNLAALYKSQGRYSEAKPLYTESLAIFERVLGVDHPSTATVRENLALLPKF